MFHLPDYIVQILDTLTAAGFQAFAVGGCVRDLLRGVVPNDYDVTTNALPNEVEALFEHTVPTGVQHGTVTVVIDGHPIEVTTFRQEFGYTDSRHPDRVSYVSDVKEDLARRDFTVNAMAYHPNVGIVDPFGGQDDLKNGILRTVGEARVRFEEDALRILRLFRFAATLGFSIEESSLKAALKRSGLLKNISRERIAAELLKTLLGKNVSVLTPLLQNGGLKFLEIGYQNPLDKISRLPQKDALRLFAFLHCCHAPLSVLKALRYSNAIGSAVHSLFQLQALDTLKTDVEIKQALRSFGRERVEDYFAFRSVFHNEDTTEREQLLQQIFDRREPYDVSHLCVDGNDLKNLGIRGRETGFVLQKLCDLVLANPSLNKPEILFEKAKEIKEQN